MIDLPKVESVWDYPRPPRLEPSGSHLRVVHAGVLVAETRRSLRVLETSHPPVYYLPPEDVTKGVLRQSSAQPSFCEFKGLAEYWTLDLSAVRGGQAASAVSVDAAWSYPQPSRNFASLRDYIAFYANRVDECTVDGERVQAQAGDFYGGWITSLVKGPFKGAPGTRGW